MVDEKFEPICEVEFTDTQTGKKLKARLSSPVLDRDKNRYYCISEIIGSEIGKKQRVYSDGNFEALTLALLRFKLLFDKETADFRTEAGSAPHMLFPKEIPWVYGKDVYQRLCNMVDEEVQKIETERTLRRESRNEK